MADDYSSHVNTLKLFDAIEDFGNSIFKEVSVPGIINHALNVLLQIPSANYVSLYFLNQDTFEFEFNSVHPDNYQDDAKTVLQKIIDKGALGKSLQTGNIEVLTDENSAEKADYVICPLIGSSGVLAVIVINVIDKFNNSEKCLNKLLKTFLLMFGITIEKFTLQESQSKSQAMLDQMVASRTMKLAQSKVQLGEKIETLKSDLTMTMPHEVRTPINQILGFSDYLIKTFIKSDIKDADDYLEIVRDIHSSAERLRRLFENYLFYARLSMISANVFEIQDLKKDITASVQPVIYDRIMMNIMQAGRKDDIKIELADSPVAMSEEYVNKIVEEIIENCYKYSDTGTGIEVFSFVKDKNYIITFIDHGRGFTSEQIQSIDAYVQFDRRSHEQQGSGLGLSIVQRILDLHDGEFAVESDPGNYTRIMIKLPIPTDYESDN